jgi:hypothetical protein
MKATAHPPPHGPARESDADANRRGGSPVGVTIRLRRRRGVLDQHPVTVERLPQDEPLLVIYDNGDAPDTELMEPAASVPDIAGVGLESVEGHVDATGTTPRAA